MEKNPNIKKTKGKLIIFVFCLLFFVFFFVFFLWQGIYLSREPVSVEEKLFSVEKGQGFLQIAENLGKEDLIKSSFYFKAYVLSQGYAGSLQAGEYLLNPSMNIPEIVHKIVSGDTASITFTIPEGFTVKQIEEKLGLTLPGESLEGFLFPDTYQFPASFSGQETVARMKDNFDRKLTADLRKEIERQGKTIFEITTMASMIEKEVKTREEKGLVSGILWKRLAAGMPLQVDATIAYVLGGEGWTFDKMRREIAVNRDIDSLYNTYKYRGLPPGPICNPGLESITAAIYPQESQYWYYLSAPDGITHFSITLEEHNIAKAKYLK